MVYPRSFVHSMSIVYNAMNDFGEFRSLSVMKKYLSGPQNIIANGHGLGFGNIFALKTIATDIL